MPGASSYPGNSKVWPIFPAVDDSQSSLPLPVQIFHYAFSKTQSTDGCMRSSLPSPTCMGKARHSNLQLTDEDARSSLPLPMRVDEAGRNKLQLSDEDTRSSLPSLTQMRHLDLHKLQSSDEDGGSSLSSGGFAMLRGWRSSRVSEESLGLEGEEHILGNTEVRTSHVLFYYLFHS